MIQTFETSSDGEKSTEQATLDVERGHGVGAETEKKLLKKLDLHIIPFIMWMYLMNFMDRGVYCEGVPDFADFPHSDYWKCPLVRHGY